MSDILPVGDVAWWRVAGWTMLHFLWLGALVGAAAMACRLLLRRAAAELRYGAALASLVMLAALPFGIAAWIVADPTYQQLSLVSDSPWQGDERHEADSTGVDNLLNVPLPSNQIIELNTPNAGATAESNAIALQAPDANRTGEASGTLSSAISMLESCVPYLPWLWLVGTPLTFLLLATGVIGAERLRRGSHVLDDGPIADALVRLRQALGVTRRVTVGVCERIAAPVLVGILRPIILLPPAAISGWSPDEIEMVLLHELAHVRRWDNLVNLLQRVVESLLFFHPAVWLVSGWARREREACCDAIVVDRTHQPHAYAALLVTLASQIREPSRPRPGLFSVATASAMAASPLRARIRRILQMEDDPMLVSGKSLAIVLGGLVLAATLAVLFVPTIGRAKESAAEGSTTEDTEGTEDSTEKANASIDNVEESPQSPADELDSSTIELNADNLLIESADGETVINADADADADGDGVTLRAHESQTKPVQQQVIETFDHPHATGVDDFSKILRAADKAREKGPWVDIVYRNQGQTIDLVTAPRPSEENWPSILGDVPRKDRVIADKAWERLGLKLVPASQLEQLYGQVRGDAGMVKIVGGNVPEGLPLPAFVGQLGQHDLNSFQDLHSWLSSESAQRGREVKVYAFAEGHEYLFDARPPVQNQPVEIELKLKPEVAHRFPSLEEQKLADLVYKRLGLEMEAIGEEDLMRVRVLGYEGGVKVAAGNAGLQRQGQSQTIQPGDILVGLHVWPTTSMKAIAEVLKREDLAELLPLKFYVVRPERTGGGGGGFGPGSESGKDVVVTGRVSVTLPESKRVPSEQRLGAGDDSLSLKAMMDEQLAQDPMAQMLMQQLMSAQYELSTLRTGQKSRSRAALEHKIAGLQQKLAEYRKQVEQRIAAQKGEVADGKPENYPSDIDRPYVDTLELRSQSQSKTDDDNASAAAPTPDTIVADPLAATSAAASTATDPGSAAEGGATKANLRYDGKTFDEWRDLWRNELSTERRLEAVTALAAFGRAGYGKESTEAILEVAGKYDFRKQVHRDSLEGRMRTGIVDALAYGTEFDPAETFSMIMARYNASPDEWHGLLVKFLLRQPQLDALALDEIRALLPHKNPDMRAAALTTVAARDPAAGAEALKTALGDPDSVVTAKALEILRGQEQVRRATDDGNVTDAAPINFPVDEFVHLLLHNKPTRLELRDGWTAFKVLRELSSETANNLVGPLTDILNDPSRAADHLTAVRALGRMGQQAAQATPVLERVLNESEEISLRVAAALALERLVPRQGGRYQQQLMGAYSRQPADDQEKIERQKMQEQIEQLMTDEQNFINSMQ